MSDTTYSPPAKRQPATRSARLSPSSVEYRVTNPVNHTRHSTTPHPETKTQSHDIAQNISCGHCSLTNLCIPVGVGAKELQKLDENIIHHETLKRGQHWFRAGDRFRSIYAVRSGCIKTYILTGAGEEQICGFHLPGEIIGLDAIDCGFYKSSAKVLQTSSVCEIPFDRLDNLLNDIPSLQKQLLRIMSKEIDNDQWLITLLGKTSADARVAAFLCNLSHRFAVRGYSAYDFILGMPRHDIANYLGLAVETVCRVFTRFQQQKYLTANGKQIQIHELKKLYELTGTLPLPAYLI